MYNFDSLPNRKLDKCRKWDESLLRQRFPKLPNEYIPMWIADMDYATAPEIISGLQELLLKGTLSYTYTYDEFYDVVVDWQHRRHGVKVTRDMITLVYGTVSTIHNIIQCFCTGSRKVIMNTPVYDPFALAAERNGVTVIANTLIVRDNRYFIDMESLEQQLQDHQPDVYLFCSPHNPSGRIWTREELVEVATICRKYGTLLVVDEVHSEHILFGNHISVGCLDVEVINQIILLTSPNKAFNIGGLKTSYALIWDEGLRCQFREQLAKNSITSPTPFGITAVIAAYRRGEEWLNAVTEYIRENYLLVKERLKNDFPDWRLMDMEASYLCWVDVSRGKIPASDLVPYLAEVSGVILEDGTHYVQDGENYVRINIATSRELLLTALDQIKCAYEALYPDKG
ncbi:TPA: aminotransferase class I/II-fold pyridoxal phosphate-dependent enzyme [Streptococcus suis]|nr:aminotransferase class I/II-fold pyridoxal phosphate-dependent enzyme [Streptococcus suis]HEP1835483.1 aminotransferase class I/II-fold pyridoxal phosphate-dependent enzyme [Streptococcus suis]